METAVPETRHRRPSRLLIVSISAVVVVLVALSGYMYYVSERRESLDKCGAGETVGTSVRVEWDWDDRGFWCVFEDQGRTILRRRP
jgi:hypothetical protein